MKQEVESLEYLLKIVQKHLQDENYDVRAMTIHLGYSRTQAYRKIKALTGVSPSEFLSEQRLTLAHAWLSDPDNKMSVTEVAYGTGFKDTGYFSRAFKRRFQVTPGKILRQKKE
jgi:AraC-like DNA-binding protein